MFLAQFERSRRQRLRFFEFPHAELEGRGVEVRIRQVIGVVLVREGHHSGRSLACKIGSAKDPRAAAGGAKG